MRPEGHRLVIFGPLPPPESGVEGMTRLILNHLAMSRSDPRVQSIRYQHVDTKVSSGISEREHFRWRKVGVVMRQMLCSIRLAARSDAAYYPISQNTTGFLRDLALIWPFWLLRRRRLVHLHGGELHAVLDRQPALLRAAMCRVFGGERAFGIALTESLVPCLEPLMPRERIFVVPNAVAAPAPPDQPAADGPLRVLFLSALMERKGYRELVLATQELRARGVAIELVLAGNPYMPSDHEWLGSLANASWIHLPGHVSATAKWDWLHAADVLALPSVAPEGQPLAILEGMAAGCAIVTTDRGGVGDTVGDDEGFVLPVDGGAALHAELGLRLGELANDRFRLRRMQSASRARYEREFQPDHFMNAWLDALQAILAPEGDRSPR